MKLLNLSAARNSQPRMNRSGSSLKLVHGLLLFALAMRLASTGTAGFSYVILAGYALLGRAQAIQALALSWLFSMLSEGVAPLASEASVGRYAVVAGAAISVLLRSLLAKEGNSASRLVLATLALGSFVIIHSMLFSPILDVSILKAILWTVVMTTLLLAWAGMDYQTRAQLERQLFGGMVLLALISLPLLFTGIGYMRNESGFQGVFSHPQAFGPTMALLGTWTTARLLGEPRPRWQYIALVGLCMALVVLSEARTAGLSLVLGVLIAAIVMLLKGGFSMSKVMPGLRSVRLQIFAVLAVVGAVLSGSMLSNILDNYLSKRSETTGIVSAYEISRGNLIDMMLDNIKADPWVGVGFGIASLQQEMFVERDPVLGLPTSAAIEKGVLPVAVLEELGVVGFVLFAAWLWLLLKRAGRGGVAPLAVLITILLFNLGESTLFSSSGFGLLPLILLAWAATGGHHHFGVRPRG